MTAYAASRTYFFDKAANQRTAICLHTTLAVYNDPEPVIVCARCMMRWELIGPLYGLPVILPLELCGECGVSIAATSPNCTMHELREAAHDSYVHNDDTRLVRASLRHVAESLRFSANSPNCGDNMRQALHAAITLLEHTLKQGN
jgi:hypothetical protein